MRERHPQEASACTQPRPRWPPSLTSHPLSCPPRGTGWGSHAAQGRVPQEGLGPTLSPRGLCPTPGGVWPCLPTAWLSAGVENGTSQP